MESKMKYEDLDVEVIGFELEDVIVTSEINEGERVP